MNLDDEMRHLAKADVDIEQGRAAIVRQGEIVDELKRDGHDTDMAVKLLATLQGTLNAMLEHRRLIVERVERYEREEKGPPTRRAT